MQETYLCKTYLGEIEISRSVLTRAVLDAVNAMDGQVLVTNKKGKLQSTGGRFGGDAADSIDIEVEGDNVLIRVYLIVRFGISMKQTTDALSEKIRKGIMKVTGIAPSTVILHVTGTLSKRVAPRDIEYRTDYEH